MLFVFTCISHVLMKCLLTYLLIQKEEEVEVNGNDESVAKSLLPDATQIDRLQSEMNELNKKIDSQKSKLTSGENFEQSTVKKNPVELISFMNVMWSVFLQCSICWGFNPSLVPLHPQVFISLV